MQSPSVLQCWHAMPGPARFLANTAKRLRPEAQGCFTLGNSTDDSSTPTGLRPIQASPANRSHEQHQPNIVWRNPHASITLCCLHSPHLLNQGTFPVSERRTNTTRPTRLFG